MMLHEIGQEQYDITYRNILPSDTDIYLGYGSGNVLAGEREGKLLLPTVGETRERYGLSREKFRFLFRVGGKDCYAVPEHEPESFGAYERKTLRFLRTLPPSGDTFAASMGLQLVLWYRRSLFCGRCGAHTVHSDTERMMRCPSCGNMIYPQICPSVIIGVLHEGKMLLTKYNPAHIMVNSGTTHAPGVTYALVAGYVESGETPEQAVIREVREEVGLRVKNIRYYKSQPWPFSSSLLFGYFCDLDGSEEITLEEQELSLAEWKAPREMPDRSKDVSLTSEMMEVFRLGKVPEDRRREE